MYEGASESGRRVSGFRKKKRGRGCRWRRGDHIFLSSRQPPKAEPKYHAHRRKEKKKLKPRKERPDGARKKKGERNTLCTEWTEWRPKEGSLMVRLLGKDRTAGGCRILRKNT